MTWKNQRSMRRPYYDLLVIGELNVDLILNQIQEFPVIGKEILAGDMCLTLGSSSAIMACNSVVNGLTTCFCGILGKDYLGKYILQELNKKSVDTRFIKQSDITNTGITVVMSYDQDRANVTFLGTMPELSMEDIPWNDIQQFRHLHISSIFMQENLLPDVSKIFQKAKKAGVSTSLDMQWDPSEKWDLDFKTCLPHVDLFLPNEAELLALTGTSSYLDAIHVVRPYANTIALKRGLNGSIGFDKEGQTIERAILHNPAFVDSIGAGDSFNAGFIKKFLEEGTLEDCLEEGNLMGAINTMGKGGTGAFKDKETLKQNIEILKNSQWKQK